MMRTIAWAAGALLLSAALIWGVLWWQERRAPVAAAPPVAEAPPATPAPAAPTIEHPIERVQDAQSEPPPQVMLDASDSALRHALAPLFKGKQLPEFVQPTSLIRHIVATVDNLSRNKVASQLQPVRPVPGTFSTIKVGELVVIAPDNAVRYAPVVAVVNAIDTRQLVAVYVRFYPLFQQAYLELGYPSGYFNDRLVAVIDHLLATPEVKQPIALVQPKVVYQYADPELEALSAGQKAMIRVGPDHAAVLKAKLVELRAAVTGSDVKR